MGGYNHKPWCTCGWCVKSSSTFYTPSPKKVKTVTKVIKDSYKWDYSHIKRIETTQSFVNPNAKCPVCDEPVFFYQSPYGGKVFFDELHPPWTKHPCTDNKSKKVPKSIGKRYTHFKKDFIWTKMGWNPHIIIDTTIIGNIFSFKVKDKVYISISNNYRVKKGSILYIKNIDNLFYKASILDEKNIEIKAVLILKDDFYSANILIQDLAEIFFKANRESNKVLMKKVIEHEVVQNHQLSKVFKFIYEYGLDNFFKTLRQVLKYCPRSVSQILQSTDDQYIKNISKNIFATFES